MPAVRVTRDDVSLRFGDPDTAAPEGDVAATPPPRIVVAVSRSEARSRVVVAVRSGEQERVIALRPARRTRDEQFFEGSFPDLRPGEQVEYTVRAELERSGAVVRLDSAEVPGGRRRFRLITEVAPSEPITTRPAGVVPVAGGASVAGGSPIAGGLVVRPERRDSRVTGSIVLEHGVPAANVRVRLYQREFGGGTTLLGEAVTNERGGYDVAYSVRGTPNIEVHAIAADGQDIQLSSTKFGAAREEKLDLVAPTKVQPPAAEFARLRAAVSPQLDDKPERLKGAVEWGDRRDISNLAATTRWDGRALALASIAYDNTDATRIPAEALYALYRAGLPTEAKTLARVDRRAVENALSKAAQAGIIDAAAVETGAKAFGEFATQERLSFRPPGKLAGLSDFVTRAPVSARDAAAFTSALKERSGGDLWARAKTAGVSEQGITDLKLQGKLAYLTLNNVELAARLQPKLRRGDARQLIELDFDQASTWNREISDLAGNDAGRLGKLIPPAFEGGSDQERLALYSEELARRVRQMDPNSVTLRQLQRGDLDGLSPDARAGIGSFLSTATAKGFRLGQTPVSSFVKQHTEDVLLPGMNSAQKKAALEHVKTLHRMYSVTPSDEALNVLLKKGFRSAYDIVAVPYEHFVRFVAPEVGSTRVAEQIYWKAQQQAATIINVFTGAKQLGVAPPLGATGGSKEKRDDQIAKATKKLSGRFPTLEGLFGGVDYCECDHCHSVLSPAAYLVDLLHVIDPDAEQWEVQKSLWAMGQGDPPKEYPHGKPYVALTARRADIQDIPLTCENTNTALPYIDIVNEILEQLVVGNAGGLKAFDTGTTSSQDLVAEPQNITWAAYGNETAETGLKYVVYPTTLPFDLPLEMVREFLRRLDLPLWKVREHVNRPEKLFAAAGKANGLTDAWFERIGLGPADVAALVDVDWFALYGYSDRTPALTELVNAKTLSRRLGVTYKELTELMKTSFINPEIDSLRVLHRLEVDVHDLERYLNPPTQNALTDAERKAFEARLDARGIKANELQPLWTNAIREQVLLLRSTTAVYEFSETKLAFARTPADPDEATALALRKLNMFVRLQRKLGWDTRRLDNALRAFIRPNTAALTAVNWKNTVRTALMYLAHLQEISERAADRVTADELLVLWAPIPTAGEQSLYERMFLGRGALPQDPAFDHKLGRYLDGSTELIAKHVDAVRQAMQVSHEEIEQIFAYLQVKDATLSIDNLSALLRYKVLARVLDVTVAELLTHLAFSPQVPKNGLSELSLTPVDTVAADVPFSETIAFLREVDLLRDAGLTTDALEGICRHRGPTIEGAEWSELAERVLLALSALPSVEPLGAGADDEAKRQFADARRRERLSVLQTLSAQLGAPEPLITTLVTGVLRDSDSGKPIIEDSLTLRAGQLPSAATRWSHYLWFAAGGTYKLTTQPAANAVLKFDPKDDSQSMKASNGTFTLADVRVSERYRLDLTLAAKGPISLAGDAVPSSIAIDDYARFATAVARLRKAVDVLAALGMTSAEVDHVRTLPAALSLNALPLTAVGDDIAAKDTFAKLLPWVELAAARRRYNAGDRFVEALRAAKRSYDVQDREAAFEADLDAALSALTGWKVEFVRAARKGLGYNTKTTGAAAPFALEMPGLTTVAGLRGMTDAVSAIVRLGLKPEDIADWSTRPIDATVATQVRAALKGRHGSGAWRRIAQATFDILRKKQRDALVARLTHMPGAIYGETQEQLFEYLLLDPGSEPPVLASRIQLAISSVQLFIQRCLMNFEVEVIPSIIDAKRWAWMSRYRIWEVNRKLFIWPENWLDPEFRDDKTHLFRDLEGALLQGDVSDDLVRTALYTYLQGLETIARLEMMTMYFEPGASADGSIVHVIARTPNAPYKYFYRKCSHRMWTPWEPLGVEIDGEHLTLTVWRGRMHLFWVTFFEKPEAKDTPNGQSLQDLVAGSPDALDPGNAVQLQLNWVEQVEGKWTNRSSTPGFIDAAEFKDRRASDPAARREFFVHVRVDPRGTDNPGDDILELHVSHGGGDTQQLVAQKFAMFSKLAPPRLDRAGSGPDLVPVQGTLPQATKWFGKGPLAVRFVAKRTRNDGVSTVDEPKNFPILTQGGEYRLLFPSNEIRLNAEETLPPVRGRPTTYIFSPQDAQHVVYRGTDNNIHDLWGTANGWFHSIASATKGADPASGEPHGYPLDEQRLHCVAYPAEGKLIELSWSHLDAPAGDPTAAWRAQTLFEAGSPSSKPVGRPLGGVFSPKRGVVFRTADGALRAAVEGAAPLKLTGGAVPTAASDPTGLVMSTTALGQTTIQSRHIFFRGEDDHVHELRSDAAGADWTHTDITVATGAPPPAVGTHPSAYAFAGQKTLQVVYRDSNGVVQQLWRSGGVSDDATLALVDGDLVLGTWHHDAIGQKFGKAEGDPTGYVTEFSSTQHVIYRGTDKQVHELFFEELVHLKGAAGWEERVLTKVIKDAPAPDGDPTGCSFERRRTQHVVYVADRRPRELIFDVDGWRQRTYELERSELDEIGPLISPFFYEDQNAPHTFFVEPSLAERTVHDWEEYVVTTEEYVEEQVPVADEIVPWFPDAIHVQPSELGLVTEAHRDRIFEDDVVLSTEKGVFGRDGGVRAKKASDPRDAYASDQPAAVAATRILDTRRGIAMDGDEALVRTARRRGGAR